MKLPPVAARNLSFVVDAHAHFDGDAVRGLQALMGVSETAAKRLVENAILLGLLHADGTVAELASLIREASVVERREILRFYLERFPPFAEWKRRVVQGFDPLEAARLTKPVFDIEDTPAEMRDWFLDLATHTGSVREEGAVTVPSAAGRMDTGSLISGILNRQESASDALSAYLGEQLWRKLPDPVRDHLNAAISKLANNEAPDEIVREAGLALDKYVSDLGTSVVGAGYAGLTLGQAAAKLKTDGVILTKHTGYTDYGTQLRNAAEHPDTDAELAHDRWLISTKSSLTYLRVVMDFMRSADAKVGGRYEL